MKNMKKLKIQYKKLVAEIFDGKRKVNNSTDQMPKVSVKLNERQGMIK